MQRPAKKPAPPPLPRPVLQDLEEAFQNRPFLGGGYGESFLPPTEAPPPPVEDRGLQIEPPPWAGQMPVAPLPEPELPMDALGEMKRQLGDVDEPRFTAGPALKMEPPERPVAEPVDWEAEAAEQAERDRADAGTRTPANDAPRSCKSCLPN